MVGAISMPLSYHTSRAVSVMVGAISMPLSYHTSRAVSAMVGTVSMPLSYHTSRAVSVMVGTVSMLEGSGASHCWFLILFFNAVLYHPFKTKGWVQDPSCWFLIVLF